MEEEGDPTEEVLTPEQREIKKTTLIDWAGLRAEFTWENLWTNRSWGNIFGHFAKVLLLSLSATLFDMTTDALSGKNFVSGTDYMKRDVNQSECRLYADWNLHEGWRQWWVLRRLHRLVLP